DAGDRYTGVAQPGTPGDGSGNAIKGGPHVGTTRLLIGVDYLVSSNVMLGARLGYAFNGAPRDTLPIHAEGRVAYFLGQSPFGRPSMREFIALIGGRAEIDNKYGVAVKQAMPASGTGVTTQNLTVYHAAGPYFGGAA